MATPGSLPFSPECGPASGAIRALAHLAARTLAAWSGLFFFDPERAREPRVRAGTEARPRREDRLYCFACRHPVTRQTERISVQGSDEHVFTNPHGFTFRIVCFREAAGCRPTGSATAAYTWFAGYRWRIALCAGCDTHLGWRYDSSADCFHGLILDRLTSRGPAE